MIAARYKVNIQYNFINVRILLKIHMHTHTHTQTHIPYIHARTPTHVRTNIIPVHILALVPPVTATWWRIRHCFRQIIVTPSCIICTSSRSAGTPRHAHPIPRNRLQHTTTPLAPPSDSLKRCRCRLRKRHMYDPRHIQLHFTPRWQIEHRHHLRRVTKQIKAFADAKTRLR